MATADMSLDSALNEKQITAEQNPVFQETKASQKPKVSILNIMRIPVAEHPIESNPIPTQNTNKPTSSPIAPYEMVALPYAKKSQLNQSVDPAMSPSTGKIIMVVNEDTLQQNSFESMLNEGQENVFIKPSITEERNQAVQLDYNQNVSTIEVLLVIDPNCSPELVKFRPGIYEGDAIPPVYSDFCIFAIDDDYVPQLPAFVQPAISIIPEPINEEQVITDKETTNKNEKFIESDGHSYVVYNQKRPLAVENTHNSEQPSNPRGRIVDARLLVTLRNTRLILIYKGYHFRRYYCQGLKIRWQCVDRKCCAFLYSYENKVTVVYLVHDHLGIIRENYTPEKPTESKAEYSLEEAINTITDLVPVNDQNAGSSNLGACNLETITLSYSNETATQTRPPHSENIFLSRVPYVFCSGNTNINFYHDPSLAITVKDSSGLQENENTIPHVMISGTENTAMILPDPLEYCVTSYEPNSSQNDATSSNSQQLLQSSYDDILVSKDVKTKVTLTSIPPISKPQVYYDGKLFINE